MDFGAKACRRIVTGDGYQEHECVGAAILDPAILRRYLGLVLIHLLVVRCGCRRAGGGRGRREQWSSERIRPAISLRFLKHSKSDALNGGHEALGHDAEQEDRRG